MGACTNVVRPAPPPRIWPIFEFYGPIFLTTLVQAPCGIVRQYLFGEIFPSAVAFLVSSDHIAQCGSNEEILLLEAQLLA